MLISKKDWRTHLHVRLMFENLTFCYSAILFWLQIFEYAKPRISQLDIPIIVYRTLHFLYLMSFNMPEILQYIWVYCMRACSYNLILSDLNMHDSAFIVIVNEISVMQQWIIILPVDQQDITNLNIAFKLYFLLICL